MIRYNKKVSYKQIKYYIESYVTSSDIGYIYYLNKQFDFGMFISNITG